MAADAEPTMFNRGASIKPEKTNQARHSNASESIAWQATQNDEPSAISRSKMQRLKHGKSQPSNKIMSYLSKN